MDLVTPLHFLRILIPVMPPTIDLSSSLRLYGRLSQGPHHLEQAHSLVTTLQ
jgi:hypothetical protein